MLNLFRVSKCIAKQHQNMIKNAFCQLLLAMKFCFNL